MTDYTQESAFFSICSSLIIDRVRSGGLATLSPEYWRFSGGHLPEILMLEGMNQFAARLATELYPGDGSGFYLPGIIEHFQTTMNMTSARMTVFGHCELINDTCRVTSTVTAESGVTIASSTVLICKIRSGIQAIVREENNPNVPVWELDCTETTSCVNPVQVRFYNDHPVFSEHFPGFPIVPGAVQAEIVMKRLISFYPQTHSVIFEKVKFIHGIRPDKPYSLCLRLLQNPLTISFSFSFMSGETRVTTGKIKLNQTN